MGSIYKNATQVVVWLGKEDKHTIPSLELISIIYKTWMDMRPLFTGKDFREALVSAGLPAFGAHVWNSLIKFFDRPWFFRAWVVQEIAFSKEVTVLCGTHQIGWNELVGASSAAIAMDAEDLILESFLNVKILSVYQTRLRKGKTIYLEDLLLKQRSRQASDPRDKVFSFLSLATNVRSDTHADGLAIVPDYGMTTFALYLRVAKESIRYYNSLTILSEAGISAGINQDRLPSWVPDWTVSPRSNEFLSFTNYAGYQACDGHSANCKFSENSLVLQLQGIRCDEIAVVGTVFSKQGTILKWFKLAKEFLDLNTEFLDSFRRTIIANVGKSKRRANSDELEAFQAYYQLLCLQEEEIPDKVFPENTAGWVPSTGEFQLFRHLVYLACFGRSFFITKKGLMGTTRRASPGDMVWIVNGAVAPLILRGTTTLGYDAVNDAVTSEDRIQLVGDAYVDGLMYGEGYDIAKLQDLVLY
jgi:hypothetical protein